MAYAHRVLDTCGYENTIRFYLVHVVTLISLIHARKRLMHTCIINTGSLGHVSALKDPSSGSKIHFDSKVNSFC